MNTYRMSSLIVAALSVVLTTALQAQEAFISRAGARCPVKEIQVERLPNMNIARTYHSVFCLNGEITVIGGHTAGFVNTRTAEYFADGQWHLLSTTYDHDWGGAIALRDGRVMVAGGYGRDLGIGQLYSVEFYDPAQHVFNDYGCMATRRAEAALLELDSGCVVIAGNWYHHDSIETYCGERLFSTLKAVTQERSQPYLLRTAKDDAILFGWEGIHGERLDHVVVDRLNGEPFISELADKWRPIKMHHEHQAQHSFIGDEANDVYDYLLLTADSCHRLAVMKVHNGSFSIYLGPEEIPTDIGHGPINYFTQPIADGQRRQAHIVGRDTTNRFYVFTMHYDTRLDRPTATALSVTPPMDSIGNSRPVVDADGNLVMTGSGLTDNFDPLPTAMRILLYPTKEEATATKIWWGCGAALLLVVSLASIILWRRKRPRKIVTDEETVTPHEPEPKIINKHADEKLMERIMQLVTEDQLFLQPDLKVNTLAELAGTSPRNVSVCIKRYTGLSFSAFISSHRIEYSKQLLREQPGMKASTVGLHSGFSNETSFFRTFKAVTGMTPTEFLNGLEGSED